MSDPSRQDSDKLQTLRSVLIGAGVVAVLFLAWRMRDALLLALAAVIVAVLLRAASEPLERYASLSPTWALTVVGGCLAIALAAVVVLLGANIRTQFADLTIELSRSLRAVEQSLGVQLLGPSPASSGEAAGHLPSLQDVLGYLASFGTALAGALSGLVLVIVAGFFLAADPETYRRGLVMLFPRSWESRVSSTLGDCGRALRLWLIAELIAMALVGILVGLGTWMIGLPAPLTLGLFAFVLEFIPIVGPILGAIPGLLLAATVGPTTLLWAALLYLAVQQLESNVITPVVERRMVSIPPALLILAVTAFGLLFGVLGVLVAAPLTVIIYVAVKKLYVRETLGRDTTVPGEDEPKEAS